MKRVLVAGLLGVAAATSGQGSEIRLLSGEAGLAAHVEGSRDDDWYLESSSNLVDWVRLDGFGTLLSARSNPPVRLVPATGEGPRFFRANRTRGLYDTNLLRTLYLKFDQANWATLLARGRENGSNTLGSLSMDNGVTNYPVGARYKGNTSYTGFQGGAPAKKSVNLEFDFTDAEGRLMGFRTVNLNNAYMDETIMREPLYFSIMERYAVSPKGSMARLYINEVYWGVYSLAEQENSDLVRRWFPSNDGDRWRAPNMAAGGGGPGGGGGNSSALGWLGTNVTRYKQSYTLMTDNSTHAWERLVHACDVLNNAPAAEFPERVEEVLAVDRWLWFLALENIFADDDSYWNKGADYGFYYEPESGRIHPVEHDGNEAFVAQDSSISPVQGATGTSRPVISRLLAVPALRQRYLAHMRTVLDESFNPAAMTAMIGHFSGLSSAAIEADTKKGFFMAAYSNDLRTLKTFITNRHKFLTNHTELRPRGPRVAAVIAPDPAPTGAQTGVVQAEVLARDEDGIDSVWLYHRVKSYGRFAAVRMLDDGAHADGGAADGVFGAELPAYPAGTKVRYYVEARSANAVKTATYFPARAEEDIEWYRVAVVSAPSTPVVINELMAANVAAVADPQGEYDDWIELHNLTDADVDLTGRYLTDEPNNPRKWAFPDGTTVPADGYLIIWADEDGRAAEGLHASFKLASGGEELLLTDTDARFNAVLDRVAFPPQPTDESYGRTAADADVWAVMEPTPGAPNP